MWPASISTMSRSRHISYETVSGTWSEKMGHIYKINGLDQSRITTYEIFDNSQLRSLYAQTDLGIFPNRCEGGTNLVLMEYMACGKPVIASNATGHTDVVNEQNALLLNDNDSIEIKDDTGRIIGRWADPSLDELVAMIEYAYQHRDRIKKFGNQAGRDMKQFTWKRSSEKLLTFLL